MSAAAATPFFSVVIPVYNRSGLLAPTVESVLGGRFSDFEIILVDDGSTDNTPDVARDFMQRDARVRYLRQENAERGAARNNGYRNARGRFVVFLDSDDTALPGYLESLHALIGQHPQHHFFAGKFRMRAGSALRGTALDGIAAGEKDLDFILRGNHLASNFCIRKADGVFRPFVEPRHYAGAEDWVCIAENLSDKTLVLGDFYELEMNQHDGRSMNENKKQIGVRTAAAAYLLERLPLSPAQRKTMQGYTDYFCAIHAHLDDDRAAALRYLRSAVKNCGLQPEFATLFAKTILGRSVITAARRIMRGA